MLRLQGDCRYRRDPGWHGDVPPRASPPAITGRSLHSSIFRRPLMNCTDIHTLIHAYHDGELDAANAIEVERHLADCPQCFSVSRGVSDLRVQLREETLRFHATSDFHRRIRATVAAAA